MKLDDKKIIKLLKKFVNADKHKCIKSYQECIEEAKEVINKKPVN